MKNKISDKDKKDILVLKKQGFTQEKIAKTLGISRSAVRYYIEKDKGSDKQQYGNPFTKAWGKDSKK